MLSESHGWHAWELACRNGRKNGYTSLKATPTCLLIDKPPQQTYGFIYYLYADPSQLYNWNTDVQSYISKCLVKLFTGISQTYIKCSPKIWNLNYNLSHASPGLPHWPLLSVPSDLMPPLELGCNSNFFFLSHCLPSLVNHKDIIVLSADTQMSLNLLNTIPP